MKNRFCALPVTAAQANPFVVRFHRHAGPVTGAKFALVAWDRDRAGVAGVIVVGRPVSRILDDGVTWEVNRVAVDPEDARNVCSFLLGAAARIAFRHRLALQLVSYTIANSSETGASYKAAGWTREARRREVVVEGGEEVTLFHPFRPRHWIRNGRVSSAVTPLPRWRWRRIAPWVLKRHAVFVDPHPLNPRICDPAGFERTLPSQVAPGSGQGGRPDSSTDTLHPAFQMGRAAAVSGARRDSNPFLRYPVKPALAVHLVDAWDRGWLDARGLELAG